MGKKDIVNIIGFRLAKDFFSFRGMILKKRGYVRKIFC